MPNPSLLASAKEIVAAALAAVEPERLIKARVSFDGAELKILGHTFDLQPFDNIYIAAIGKAAPFMAKSINEILGERVKDGIFLYLPEAHIHLENLNLRGLPTSHPLPDERNLQAAQDILALASGLGEKDLLLVLISGGGSAQVCLPVENVSLAEKRYLTETLLKAGANIKELNTVRKHLSGIKGGRLAQAAYPATVIGLIISDVIGNNPETIASGPTYWDSSSYGEALHVLKKYSLESSVPASVVETLEKGIGGGIPETLRKEDPAFARTFNFIIGENKHALSAARSRAEGIGFKSFVLTSSDQGEAREAARNYLSFIASLQVAPCSQPLCLLSGGELTVRVTGKGQGGRNQEFVLAVLGEIGSQTPAFQDWLIMSAGSDGVDGPTDAAGAWISPLIQEKARRLSLNLRQYLDDNDAYNFFAQAGGLIKTGLTHTNVMDIRIFLLKP